MITVVPGAQMRAHNGPAGAHRRRLGRMELLEPMLQNLRSRSVHNGAAM